jgi:nitrous oxide reductase accessory protein NosL
MRHERRSSPPRSNAVFAAPGLRGALLAALLGTLLTLGCARRGGAPTIRLGAACATCGMEVRDLRFACARASARGTRVYDSIECLLRDGVPDGDAATRLYLTDYDAAALHAADSMWVVRGSFPSPMGGGFAAFLSRSSADEVASTAAGRVDRLRRFVAPAADGTP